MNHLIELARARISSVLMRKQIGATRKSADQITRAMKPKPKPKKPKQSSEYPKYESPYQKKNKNLIAKAQEMRGKGATQMQIAQATGRTQTWVSKALKAPEGSNSILNA